ncbi:uncharacterized protein Nmag_0350 [Natrialba magadii ATCC 43099]|uniref:Small CPxCG-related zinc finger protein n=1 Tax=Natrialba magadii (strain ATCC 43099 / DSM 3394 / CCM 3739 / CIP 104546 / IAM 13178 / JCM 8861 / NBRC 102185 / NCIMB 2190 / MS3) TaxID=547559 RepID=D3SXC0_NATMM|nr:hypothetical protein [Natrialba magadii]ADD03940.1 uncharacterized protein Nmag_0350 [Natrialba magadii ATCC 43099]ELY33603.1 hypothetical protein C500_02185 [Natrialba magadii ATCC 43099]
MSYQVRCDSCDFDQELAGWVEASSAARKHEAEYGSHWVSIHDLQIA